MKLKVLRVLSMNTNLKFFKDLGWLVVSKSSVLLLGLIVNFSLPLILSVNEYGEYRLLLYYLSLITVFGFGINESIFIKFSGYNIIDIERSSINNHFSLMIISQLFFSVTIIGISFLNLNSIHFIMYIFLAINMFLANINSFYMTVSQITKNFKHYSIITIIGRFLIFIPIILSLRFEMIVFIFYITLTINNIIQLVIHKQKFSFQIDLKNISISSVKIILKTGLPLLVTNYLVKFIFALDRLFLDILFDVEVFSYYSFAYSIVVTINIIIDSLYLMIYQYIKNNDQFNFKDIYRYLSLFLLIFTSFSLIITIPVIYIINTYVPNYIKSIEYLWFMFPILLFKVNISVVKRIYFIHTNKQKEVFFINLSVVLIYISLIIITNLILNESIMIVISSFLIYLIWFIINEIFISKNGIKTDKKNILFIIYVLICYYVMYLSSDKMLLSFILYSVLLIFMIIFLFKRDLKKIIIIGGKLKQ
jgi:O-antigen/teichoic acid export membrane protein